MPASQRPHPVSARLLWIAGVALGVLVGILVGVQIVRHHMAVSTELSVAKA